MALEVNGDPFTGAELRTTGKGTHLGKFTGTGFVAFSEPDDDLLTVGTGTVTFVAANGDELDTEFSGVLDLNTDEAEETLTAPAEASIRARLARKGQGSYHRIYAAHFQTLPRNNATILQGHPGHVCNVVFGPGGYRLTTNGKIGGEDLGSLHRCRRSLDR